jgi:CRP/FNR family transcriptional regulator, anaerobic regulatory protein
MIASMQTTPPPLRLEPLRTACSDCNLKELCLPVGLSSDDMDKLDGLVGERKVVLRGEALFRAQERFHALYAVRSGFFKTCLASEDGRVQVTGFQMAGELLGLDGIGSGHHTVNAEALEDSSVCVLPFADLENLAREFGALQTQLHRIMSREIVRDHGVMMLLGSMRAEERVAAFLLNLTQRLQARGYSPHELVLRMTREEIGSYLGLKLETVSRTFSKFQDDSILEVKQRQITILKPEALQRLVSAAAC